MWSDSITTLNPYEAITDAFHRRRAAIHLRRVLRLLNSINAEIGEVENQIDQRSVNTRVIHNVQTSLNNTYLTIQGMLFADYE